MERTKVSGIDFSDTFNYSLTKNFTQVPNSLLKNPKISAKAKTILCILLSNKEGWKSHKTAINNQMKEGITAIEKALTELEQHGYLARVQVRNKINKRRIGSFWAYTDIPGQFNLDERQETFAKKGFDLYYRKPDIESYIIETHIIETYPYNNTNSNKTKNNNTKKSIKKISSNGKEINFYFNTPKFKHYWDQWKDYKQTEFNFKYKSSISEQSALTELYNLSGQDQKTAISIIEQSFSKGWKGFFALQDKKNGQPAQSNRHRSSEIKYPEGTKIE